MGAAYIVTTARTAGGRRGGRFAGVHPVDLGAVIIPSSTAHAPCAEERETGAEHSGPRMSDEHRISSGMKAINSGPI